MSTSKAVAIVGVGAVLPDAPDAVTFWRNILDCRYSISDVPPERWRPELYYHPDPSVPDKTYSKIGAWVRGFHFEPLKLGIAIPPRVLAVMDEAQQWGIYCAWQALQDYGYPQKSLNLERVAVILGNSMAGEEHYRTSLRIYLPEYLEVLTSLTEFRTLPAETQAALAGGLQAGIQSKISSITEDTMPGELANIIAGRIANVFNFGGPNFITDAACASSLAALQNAVEGLIAHHFDAALSGGVDRNMGVESYVKFSKIGALSPDGSRPYADGANGFVMGEGAVIFLLKRLVDAERDGDKIYAVIRGIGGSSDGKGKGITAPNPLGQQRAIERAWKAAGLSPETAGLIEGHGTSTRVGDVVEVGSLNSVFSPFNLPAGKIALGSVKSNIGHLKSAAGAASLLKVMYALHEKILPPSANFSRPNPNIDFAHIPFYVITEPRPWEVKTNQVRRAGISSFGFGGTNFHMVVEEYVPGSLSAEKAVFPGIDIEATKAEPVVETIAVAGAPTPYHGLLFLGAKNSQELQRQLSEVVERARQGIVPPRLCPNREQLSQPERLAISYQDADELVKLGERALNALSNHGGAVWAPLNAQGIFYGTGKPGKIAFLYPGQGSQYINMLRDLYEIEAVVADTFRQADEVMTPLLGKPLSSYIFCDGDEAALKAAESELRNTVITQPALLTVDVALSRLLAKFGIKPELVIGHSLGEYAALVAAEVLSFNEALEVVSARGREMARLSVADNGCMAAISAPLSEVERLLQSVAGYVIIANINSLSQCVIGGETAAVEAAIDTFKAAGIEATKIPVSHAFHTRIVAPASEPLRRVIERMHVHPPKLPIIANVSGDIYPNTREEIIDILAQQVASPVQFVKGVQKLYAEGARLFVEVGPKRVVSVLAADTLKEHRDTIFLATNHPRKGGVISFHEALCGLYAAGVGGGEPPSEIQAPIEIQTKELALPSHDGRLPLTGSLVISGAGLGLPGKANHVFDDANIPALLNGRMCIEPLPLETRQMMVEKRVTRLVKSENGAENQLIDDLEKTVKLGGQRGAFDLCQEFGLPEERVDVYDITTQLAIAAGIEALRDAGIPLVMAYKPTSRGGLLPDRWKLPEALADETGVIFASAFPGLERMAEEASRFYTHQRLLDRLEELRRMQQDIPIDQTELQRIFAQRIGELERQIDEMDYHFDRRFVFRVLAMGHSQFAEYIGARGPNTHVNAACASTTHAIAIAEDWLRSGRCRRVIVISGDDVTSGHIAPWIGTSLMASGAATVEGDLRLAALPFDRRRNGMLMGMGAAALVIETEDAVRERGMYGICELLATFIANSAFHSTRLDIQHIGDAMERLMSLAEQRFGIRRDVIAPQTVFISHETYTPARGGSASAEIHALRRVFGEQASQVLIANTKGFTGHSMGVGIEDVIAVKSLEYGIVPPIAHIQEGFEPDPELGDLNLSRGGQYPVQYALRLGAGFGSQLAMTLMHKITAPVERKDAAVYQQWLADVAGYEVAEVEVVQRTLRIHHRGAPTKPPMSSRWQYGQGPTRWAGRQSRVLDGAVEQGVTTPPAPATPPSLPEPQAIQPSAATAAAMPVNEEIKAYLLSVVSEKTGYPPEMLDMDLDLEADLGIDTVKQAELFATIRAHYDIPRREDLRLSDYNTLNKVLQFFNSALGQKASQLLGVPSSQSDASPTPLEAHRNVPLSPATTEALVTPITSEVLTPAEEEIKTYILSVVSEKTGYPPEMLDMDLDLEADLGIDTVKQAELFATIRAHYDIPRREDLRLSDYNTLNKVLQFFSAVLSQKVGPHVGETPSQAETSVSPSPTIPEAPAKLVASEASTATITPNEEEIKAYILAVVSEKTGYPPEMLDMDLDLEADLGIDTVKQAELFATVRTHYGIPRREDLRLSDYNTLAKVLQFIRDALSQQTIATNAEPSLHPPLVEMSVPSPVTTQIRRRVPLPVLRPNLELCTPTSVKLESGKHVIVVSDKGNTAEALARRLRSRKVKSITLRPAAISADRIKKLTSEGSIDGVYFLPALDSEPTLSEMTQETWQQLLEERLYALYTLMRSLPGQPFLVCATRLGGLHGYSPAEIPAPLGGAVSGFAKALAMERPDSLVKVVDFDHQASGVDIASRLVAETLRDPAVVEVGYANGLRYSLTQVEKPALQPSDLPLDQETVFLVSGGTGGITAPVVLDLAQASRGRFYLLGRTQLPPEDDPDLLLLASDRAGLKRALMERLAVENKKVTPVQVENRLAALERAAATLETIRKIRELGGKAEYLLCDVTEASNVAQAVQEVVKAAGRVDILIHAAGWEYSRKLESKPEDEFRRTVATKADGFFNLFKALETAACLPKACVSFTSIAGRFGNAGQTDYCAANDLLCKLANGLRAHYPQTRFIALDWGAWAEVGMASRGNIPEAMARAGIEMMRPSEAAALVRQELLYTSGDSEIILAASLGALLVPRRPNSGLDVGRADQALRQGKPIHKMLSHLTNLDLHEGIYLEADLDPKQEAFLQDHAPDGTPLLPGVIGIEGFSVAAQHIASVLAAGKNKFHVARLEDILFKTPFKFYRNEPRHILWKALPVHERGELVVYVALESTFAYHAREPEKMEHFCGKVYLELQHKHPAITVEPPHWKHDARTVNAEDIYRLYFHGPTFRVLEAVQVSGDLVLGKLNRDLPSLTAVSQGTVTNPILLELCFQTAGVWEIGQNGVLSLPHSIGEISLYHTQTNGVPIYAEVIPMPDQNGASCFNARVVDADGRLYLELKNYHTTPLPYTMEKELVKPFEALKQSR